MPEKYNLNIKPNSNIIPHKAGRSDLIVFDEKKRQKAVQLLRKIPACTEAVKSLSERKTYKAIITPDAWARIEKGAAALDKKDNGLLGALIRDVETGQVTNQVNLQEVTPDQLGVLNELATQQALADIVHRLEAIDEKITDVLQGQLNDRLAEVESGIHIYDQAAVASDHDIKRALMVNAIQKLNEGRIKLIKSTDFAFLDTLPRSTLRKLISPIMDINKHVESHAEPVLKAAHAIIRASRYLVIAYSDLNEAGSLRVSLEQIKDELMGFQDKTRELVRWLPPSSDLHENLTAISMGVLPNIHDLDEIPQKSLVLEFQPKELLPPKGV